MVEEVVARSVAEEEEVVAEPKVRLLEVWKRVVRRGGLGR